METNFKVSKWMRLFLVVAIMCVFFAVINKIAVEWDFGQATFREIGTAFAFTFGGLIAFLDIFWDSIWDDSVVAEKLGLKDTHSQLTKGVVLFGSSFCLVYFATVLISGAVAGPAILIVAILISAYIAFPETGDDYVLLGAWIAMVVVGMLLGWYTFEEWIGAQTGIFNIF